MILCVSRAFLGTRFGKTQVAGAVLIMLGAGISSVDALYGGEDGGGGGEEEISKGDDGNSMKYLSILFYFCSNIPR